MKKKLEDPICIKAMEIRNRLVLPPLTTNYGTDKGLVTPDLLRFYQVRSRQMGLVIVEAAAVSPEGRIIPGGIGLWDDSHIPGMGALAQTIQKEGAKAVIQINHAGAKAWPFEGITSWIAPSEIACRPGIVPRPADQGDIDGVVTAFARSAARAKTAGFDGVEIHGAHLYLLSQFFSPLTNQRTDRYGGAIEGRAALALDIVKAVRKAVGPKTPVFFRLNVLEKIEGGQTPEDSLVLSRMLADAGVDALDLSLAVQGTWKEENGTKILMTTSAYAQGESTGDVTAMAGRFKEESGLPVIAVGRLGSGSATREALEEGADLVAIGRQMICDPETAEKILRGRESAILECEACQACFASLGKGKPVQCKQNRNLPD